MMGEPSDGTRASEGKLNSSQRTATSGSQPGPADSGHLPTVTQDSGSASSGRSGASAFAGTTPKQVGKYEVIRMLGAGGMGAVYLARQEKPTRNVALKLIRPDLASLHALRRFELEAEVLGRLQHQGIAQIYEAGTHQTDHARQPYFAMELVEGRPLTDYAAKEQLTLRQKLELFAQVCDAVQHAHQKGVIHRDLKPANILVTDEGQPKILDFGVARAVDDDIQMTMQTDIGQLVGTVPYMSPEQVSGRSSELDTRSDVYSLGVLLYELLSGRLPYEVVKNSVYEAARVIREEEPTRLSTVNHSLRGDVDTIVAKALEKERERRYQSASALAADIRRFLGNEPIVARPPTTLYQIRKFAARNRGLVAGIAAAFLVLLIGAAVSTTLAFREAAQRRTAEKARADLEEVVDFQVKMLSRIKPHEMGTSLHADLRQRIESAERERGTSEEAMGHKLDAFDAAMAHINITDAARAILDANILAPASDAVATKFADHPLVEARMRHALSSMYRGQGLSEKAVPQAQRALELRLAALGPEHRHTLQVKSHLAMLLWDLGRYDESGEILSDVIPVWERAFGPEDKDTLTAKMCQAVLYMNLGQSSEARIILANILKIQERTLGPEHVDVATTLDNLAGTYSNLGAYDKAAPLFERALDIYRSVHGDESSYSAGTLRRLANVYQHVGRRKEAVDLSHRALDIMRRTYGERFPRTVEAMSSLVDLYKEQSRFAEAGPLAARVLELRRELLGDHHPETLDAMDDLGIILSLSGRHEDAEPVLIKALERSRESLGADAPATLDRLNNLAVQYWYQGQLREAEPLFVEVLDRTKRHYGDDHPEIGIALDNLAILYTRQGRVDEAERLIRQAVSIYESTLGENDAKALKATAGLGALAFTRGDYDKAADIYVDVLERERTHLGPDHQLTLEAAHNLAVTYHRLERYADAEAQLLDLISRRRRIFAPDHPETLDTIWELASIYSETDRMDEARPLLEEVIAARRKAALATDANAAALDAAALALVESPVEELADATEAVRFARRANDLTSHSSPMFLDTLARALDAAGDRPAAAETQRKAIALLPDQAPDRGEYETRLADYESETN